MGYTPAQRLLAGRAAAGHAADRRRAADRHRHDHRPGHGHRAHRPRRPRLPHHQRGIRRFFPTAIYVGVRRSASLLGRRSPTSACSWLQRRLTPWARAPAERLSRWSSSARSSPGSPIRRTGPARERHPPAALASTSSLSGVVARRGHRRSRCRSASCIGHTGRGAAAGDHHRQHRPRHSVARLAGHRLSDHCSPLRTRGLGFAARRSSRWSLLGIPPIVTNTYAGIREVDRDIVEAARGMGMRESRDRPRRSSSRSRCRSSWPASASSAVQVVATATLAHDRRRRDARRIHRPGHRRARARSRGRRRHPRGAPRHPRPSSASPCFSAARRRPGCAAQASRAPTGCAPRSPARQRTERAVPCARRTLRGRC